MPPNAEEELRALRALVRETRRDLGLSQEAAGLLGDLGRKYLGQVERGELVPTVRGLAGLAQAFGVTPAAFLRAYADRLDSVLISGQFSSPQARRARDIPRAGAPHREPPPAA